MPADRLTGKTYTWVWQFTPRCKNRTNRFTRWCKNWTNEFTHRYKKQTNKCVKSSQEQEKLRNSWILRQSIVLIFHAQFSRFDATSLKDRQQSNCFRNSLFDHSPFRKQSRNPPLKSTNMLKTVMFGTLKSLSIHCHVLLDSDTCPSNTDNIVIVVCRVDWWWWSTTKWD